MMWGLCHKLFGWHYVIIRTDIGTFIRRVRLMKDGTTLEVDKIHGFHSRINMAGQFRGPGWMKSMECLTWRHASYKQAIEALDKEEMSK